MEEKHYDFFLEQALRILPCHPGADPETLAACSATVPRPGRPVRGASAIRQTGSRDCTHCLRPHVRENYGEDFWRRCRRFWS